jgi:hypothetical protein
MSFHASVHSLFVKEEFNITELKINIYMHQHSKGTSNATTLWNREHAIGIGPYRSSGSRTVEAQRILNLLLLSDFPILGISLASSSYSPGNFPSQ